MAPTTPPPLTLTLVTENRHKVEEWTAICAHLAPWLLVRPWSPAEPVNEDGVTFEANARLKAEAGLALAGQTDAVVGEDTGIIVPALAGLYSLSEFPGLWSNRWLTDPIAEQLGIDPARFDNWSAVRNAALLKLLAPETDRHAFYRCALVAFRFNLGQPASTTDVITATGEWRLTVAREASGKGGFGYDPIMRTPEGQSVADLSADEKNQLSHRAQAIQQLLPRLFPERFNLQFDLSGYQPINPLVSSQTQQQESG